MEIKEILLNIFLISSVTYIIARTISYSQESEERALKKKKDQDRRLHIAAISGDKEAAQAWSDSSGGVR